MPLPLPLQEQFKVATGPSVIRRSLWEFSTRLNNICWCENDSATNNCVVRIHSLAMVALFLLRIIHAAFAAKYKLNCVVVSKNTMTNYVHDCYKSHRISVTRHKKRFHRTHRQSCGAALRCFERERKREFIENIPQRMKSFNSVDIFSEVTWTLTGTLLIICIIDQMAFWLPSSICSALKKWKQRISTFGKRNARYIDGSSRWWLIHFQYKHRFRWVKSISRLTLALHV